MPRTNANAKTSAVHPGRAARRVHGESFTIKGFAMDDERLKNDGSLLGKKVIVSRADASLDRMGLTALGDAPRGKIERFEMSLAKFQN